MLRVKLKNIADEAKTIRIEEQRANKARNFKLQSELREHRVGTVRRAARETLLAYQFLRGFPYAAVEKPNSKPLSKDSIKRIEYMCRRYGKQTLDFKKWQRGSLLKAA